MKFQVYNGPMVKLKYPDGTIVVVAPKCKLPGCDRRINIQLSSMFCRPHALQSVINYDNQRAQTNENR